MSSVIVELTKRNNILKLYISGDNKDRVVLIVKSSYNTHLNHMRVHTVLPLLPERNVCDGHVVLRGPDSVGSLHGVQLDVVAEKITVGLVDRIKKPIMHIILTINVRPIKKERDIIYFRKKYLIMNFRGRFRH